MHSRNTTRECMLSQLPDWTNSSSLFKAMKIANWLIYHCSLLSQRFVWTCSNNDLNFAACAQIMELEWAYTPSSQTGQIFLPPLKAMKMANWLIYNCSLLFQWPVLTCFIVDLNFTTRLMHNNQEKLLIYAYTPSSLTVQTYYITLFIIVSMTCVNLL